MKHLMERISTQPSGLSGTFDQVVTSRDGRVMGHTVYIENKDPSFGERVSTLHDEIIFVFDGEVVASTKYCDNPTPKIALSPDGSKFAISIALRSMTPDDGSAVCDRIFINGTCEYETEFGFEVDDMLWLSDTELLWKVWDNDREFRFFLNGEDVTGRIKFQHFITGDRTHKALVTDGDEEYTIDEYGNCSDRRPATVKEFGVSLTAAELEEQQERQKNTPRYEGEGDSPHRVIYRGETGPYFDEIGGGLNPFKFTLNEANDRIAYLGVLYAKWVRPTARFFEKRFERAMEIEHERNTTPWWSLPVVMLYNPYFGIVYGAAKYSKRLFPVNGTRVWEKGYKQAAIQLLTPDNQLVVRAFVRGGECVVIDEVEGPVFDAIEHVRHLTDENVICYIGQKGNDFYRVTVSL